MDIVTLLPLILIGGVFYLLILRPAKKRQQQQQATLNAVRAGQRIMTTAGLFGTVTDVTDDEIGLEIAPGIVVRYVKAAVAKVVEDDAASLDGELILTDHDADAASGATASVSSATGLDAATGGAAADRTNGNADTHDSVGASGEPGAPKA